MKLLYGLEKLVLRELKSFWKTKTILIIPLISIAIINGFIFLILYIMPDIAAAAGEEFETTVTKTLQTYTQLTGMVGAIVTIISTHGIVIGEIESGTLPWLLSKPVTRTAYIFSKWVSRIVLFGLGIIIIPSIITYLQIRIFFNEAPLASNFLLGLPILFFYISGVLLMTIAISVATKNRILTLGVMLGVIFSSGIIPIISTQIYSYTPFILSESFALLVMEGVVIPSVIPFISTAGLSLGSILYTLISFQKQDF